MPLRNSSKWHFLRKLKKGLHSSLTEKAPKGIIIHYKERKNADLESEDVHHE